MSTIKGRTDKVTQKSTGLRYICKIYVNVFLCASLRQGFRSFLYLAVRVTRAKGEGLQWLVATEVLILDMLQRRSMSACWIFRWQERFFLFPALYKMNVFRIRKSSVIISNKPLLVNIGQVSCIFWTYTLSNHITYSQGRICADHGACSSFMPNV